MAAKTSSEDISSEKTTKDMKSEVEEQQQPLLNGPIQPISTETAKASSVAGAMEQNFFGVG